MFSKQFNQLFHDSKSWKKLTTFSRIEITTTLAQELLNMNDHNRPIKQVIVEKYAYDMKNDLWQYTGDTIKISKTGNLLDGQHRLLAIQQSGKPQHFNIQTGLEDESFDVMDIGKLRTGGDIIAIMGYKNHNVFAGAVRLVALYQRTRLDKSFTMASSFNMRNTEITAWIEKHGGEKIDECVQIGVQCYSRSKICTPSTYAAFMYILGGKNWEQARTFFEMFSSGENISSTNYSMIYLLRQKLINMMASKLTFKNSYEKHALIIKAWNYFRDKREIKQLTWQSDKELFPIPK